MRRLQPTGHFQRSPRRIRWSPLWTNTISSPFASGIGEGTAVVGSSTEVFVAISSDHCSQTADRWLSTACCASVQSLLSWPDWASSTTAAHKPRPESIFIAAAAGKIHILPSNHRRCLFSGTMEAGGAWRQRSIPTSSRARQELQGADHSTIPPSWTAREASKLGGG